MTKQKLFLILMATFLMMIPVWFGLRLAQARQEIDKETEAMFVDTPPLQTTSSLEILPLYEAVSDQSNLITGHGVSYLIHTDSVTILFDVGDNPEQLEVAPFAQNMQTLGIDWREIYRIVISHPHPDHIGGLKAWRQRTLSFGDLPGGLGERLVFVPHVTTYPGAVHATIPTLPAPDIATTGVLSYLESFPFSLFVPKGGEQALVIHVENHGLVLITGCGHPGVERLVKQAESLYGKQVIGVVGGLHTITATAEQLQSQILFLQSRDPELIALSPHDSSPESLTAYQQAFPDVYQALKVGEAIQFP